MLGLIGLLLALITIRELECICPVEIVPNSNVLQVTVSLAWTPMRHSVNPVAGYRVGLVALLQRGEREIYVAAGGGKRRRSACTEPLADPCSRWFQTPIANLILRKSRLRLEHRWRLSVCTLTWRRRNVMGINY